MLCIFTQKEFKITYAWNKTEFYENSETELLACWLWVLLLIFKTSQQNFGRLRTWTLINGLASIRGLNRCPSLEKWINHYLTSYFLSLLFHIISDPTRKMKDLFKHLKPSSIVWKSDWPVTQTKFSRLQREQKQQISQKFLNIFVRAHDVEK